MITIWKQELAPHVIQEISVPRGAEILCAREQYEKICVWHRCDDSAPTEPRTIEICGTGNSAPEDARYLGTAALQNGRLQLHIFEH